MSSGLFKNLTYKYLFTNRIYVIYKYKEDLGLNNLQGLIYHKNQPTNLGCIHPTPFAMGRRSIFKE